MPWGGGGGVGPWQCVPFCLIKNITFSVSSKQHVQPMFKNQKNGKQIYIKCSKTYFSVCRCSFLENKLLVS